MEPLINQIDNQVIIVQKLMCSSAEVTIGPNRQSKGYKFNFLLAAGNAEARHSNKSETTRSF